MSWSARPPKLKYEPAKGKYKSNTSIEDKLNNQKEQEINKGKEMGNSHTRK